MDTIGTLQGHIAGHIGKCPKKCPLSVPELDIYLDVKTLIYKGSGKKCPKWPTFFHSLASTI
nr:MAG TPA: hypothetical protein [Caudoviricetes sp.]